MKQIIEHWDESHGIARCILNYTTSAGISLQGIGIAECHPDDYPYISKLTGGIIAEYRAEIDLLKKINNYEIKPGIAALKHVYCTMRHSKRYNEKSYEDLLRDYKKSFNRDVNYGVTNIGVHLDDYIFELDGKLAKEYLSEGEQKSAVIAFKLSEVKYCMNKMNTTPILILDDLFSELDEKKINKIIGSFNKNFQIFITTTDIKHLNKKLLTDCTLIKLTEKKVEVIDYE